MAYRHPHSSLKFHSLHSIFHPSKSAEPLSTHPAQPLLCKQAEFSKHLFTCGYPLWNPDPDRLPPARQSVGLRIGDVGTVDEHGGFDFFFNILEGYPGSPSSQPIFPQIQEDNVHYQGGSLLGCQVISSPLTPWAIDQLPVDMSNTINITHRTTQYSATLSEDGAHVILPQGAELFELGPELRQLFEDHARDHGSEWLERFQARLGWPRANAIYLLTGFYKTCSWSIASFSMQGVANTDPVHVRCTLVEADGRTIRESSVWEPTGRFNYKIGPPPDRQGRNNQTVFIRGLRITPGPNLSEQLEGPSKRQGGRFLGGKLPPPWLRNKPAGSSGKATGTGTPRGNVIIERIPPISQLHNAAHSFPNIIIYGGTGAGKSSIINLIAGQKLADTSDDALGCTFQHQRYMVPLNGMPCVLWDTPGLDEVTKGTAPTGPAESDLRAWMRGLARSEGIHLIIYCIRAPRLIVSLKRNYDLFYVTVCQKKVPVALVVTGLEHQQGEMETWWSENEAVLRQYGMRFDAHACVTTLDIEDPVIQQRRSDSQMLLRELVVRYSGLPAWKADPDHPPAISRRLLSGFRTVFHKISQDDAVERAISNV